MKNNIKNTREAVKEKILTLVLGAFGLVAALAWNDAIQTIFKIIFPQSQGLIEKLSYAVLVTIIFALIALQIKKTSENVKEE